MEDHHLEVMGQGHPQGRELRDIPISILSAKAEQEMLKQKMHAPDKAMVHLAAERSTEEEEFKTEDQLVSETRIEKGYHTCHCFKEFFQDDTVEKFVVSNLKGASNTGFFWITLFCMVAALVIGISSFVFGYNSFYYDLVHSINVQSNALIMSNQVHLISHFDEDFSYIFRRHSRAQGIFVFTSAAVQFTNFVCMIFYMANNTYRTRILFNGFVQIVMLFFEIFWTILIQYSISIEKNRAVEAGEKIRHSYLNPALAKTTGNTGTVVAHVSIYLGKLMETDLSGRQTRSILEYCAHDLSLIPNKVLALIQEFHMCPDNVSKEYALYLNLSNLILHFLIFCLCLIWRCSAIDTQRMSHSSTERTDILPEDLELDMKDENSTSSEDSESSSSDEEEFGAERVKPEHQTKQGFIPSDDFKAIFYSPSTGTLSPLHTESHMNIHSKSLMDVHHGHGGKADVMAPAKSREQRKIVLIGNREFRDTRRSSGNTEG